MLKVEICIKRKYATYTCECGGIRGVIINYAAILMTCPNCGLVIPGPNIIFENMAQKIHWHRIGKVML